MITPVGLNTSQSCAAVLAGVSAYEESLVYNKRFVPMTLAVLPEEAFPPLEEALETASAVAQRRQRMLRLAQPALHEALESLPENVSVPLFLAGPEALPDAEPPVSPRILTEIASQTKAPLDLNASMVFAQGRAAAMLAAQAALACLAGGKHDYALLGGVDTYLDLMLLAQLDQEDRVLAEGVMDGFAPGEGAAFLLLCSDRAAAAAGHKAVARLHAPGISSEPGHRYSDEPYTGDGLANAVRDALPAAGGKPVKTIYSSLNGENIGAKEWGVAFSRNHEAFDPQAVLEHPADCIGDTGAAAGPLLIAMAATGLSQRLLTSPVLVYCSSDGPHRGAVCVSAGP